MGNVFVVTWVEVPYEEGEQGLTHLHSAWSSREAAEKETGGSDFYTITEMPLDPKPTPR